MLQSMRHLAHSWVVKGLMLFLIISFSIWGIGDIFRGNPLKRTIATVGRDTITVGQVQSAFEQDLARARQSLFGGELTAQQARRIGLLDRALEGEVKRALIEQDIRRLSIDVPQDAVLKMLAGQSELRDSKGGFDKDKFRQILAQQGISELSFVSREQQSMAQQILFNAVDTSFTIPQSFIDTIFRARAQKHVLDVVTIDADKISGVSTPDDKNLNEFYAANPGSFSAPEYRTLTLATLNTEDLEKDIIISDADIKKDYETKAKQLEHPEQRDIVQTVVQDEAKAKHIAAQARSTGDLFAAARAEKESAIPLNKMEEKNFLPELAKVVFSIREKGITDPVKTQLGWHVVQVKTIIPAGTPSFESMQTQLRDDMRRDQAIESATHIVNQLDDQLAAGHALEDIADEFKLHLIKITSVDTNGVTIEGSEPKAYPHKTQVLRDAFAQNAGETGAIEDDKSGHYFVVRTDSITPATVKPFESVKDQVAEAWKAKERIVKAQSLADEVEKALQSGKQLSAFNGQQAVTTHTSLPLSLIGDNDPSLPPELVKRALSLKKGDTTTSLVKNQIIVARLSAIEHVETSSTDPRRAALEAELKKDFATEALDQYLNYLHDVFAVKIDNSALDQLRQQDE